MELTKRQRWELSLVVMISLVMMGLVISAGRLDLISGKRTAVLFDKRNGDLQASGGGEEHFEGDWQFTQKGLRLQPDQSGTVMIRLRNDKQGPLVAFFYGVPGHGLHVSVSVSGDSQIFKEVASDLTLQGDRVNLTPIGNQPKTVWLKIQATVDPSTSGGKPSRFSRLRIVASQAPIIFPNWPIAALLVLTPALAYIVRKRNRHAGALAYSLVVLVGMVFLAEAIEWDQASKGPRPWWEEVIASQEWDFFFLLPYGLLLGYLGCQVGITKSSNPQHRLWSFFALAGILIMAGSSRLGRLMEVIPGRLDGDAVHYMQVANTMLSPYDTGFREPFWIWVLKTWFWLVGESVFNLRLLTVGLSLLLIAAAYKFFRDYTGQPLVGLLVAGMMGMNEYLISLSVRGLREEVYLIGILCLVYWVLVPQPQLSPTRQGIVLGLSGAAVQLTRFNSYVFIFPFLLYWAWKQGREEWKFVALPITLILVLSVPHMVHNYREFGDPMFSVNIHFHFAQQFEFVFYKYDECEGCMSREELWEKIIPSPESRGFFEYMFGMHSVKEIFETTIRGYRDMYLRPTSLFEIQSGVQSGTGFLFYVLGLGVILFGPYREILGVIVLLANGVPFAMAMGIEPRLGVQTVPFVTFIFAYGLWWSITRSIGLLNQVQVGNWDRRHSSKNGLKKMWSGVLRQ